MKKLSLQVIGDVSSGGIDGFPCDVFDSTEVGNYSDIEQADGVDLFMNGKISGAVGRFQRYVYIRTNQNARDLSPIAILKIGGIPSQRVAVTNPGGLIDFWNKNDETTMENDLRAYILARAQTGIKRFLLRTPFGSLGAPVPFNQWFTQSAAQQNVLNTVIPDMISDHGYEFMLYSGFLIVTDPTTLSMDDARLFTGGDATDEAIVVANFQPWADIGVTTFFMDNAGLVDAPLTAPETPADYRQGARDLADFITTQGWRFVYESMPRDLGDPNLIESAEVNAHGGAIRQETLESRDADVLTPPADYVFNEGQAFVWVTDTGMDGINPVDRGVLFMEGGYILIARPEDARLDQAVIDAYAKFWNRYSQRVVLHEVVGSFTAGEILQTGPTASGPFTDTGLVIDTPTGQVDCDCDTGVPQNPGPTDLPDFKTNEAGVPQFPQTPDSDGSTSVLEIGGLGGLVAPVTRTEMGFGTGRAGDEEPGRRYIYDLAAPLSTDPVGGSWIGSLSGAEADHVARPTPTTLQVVGFIYGTAGTRFLHGETITNGVVVGTLSNPHGERLTVANHDGDDPAAGSVDDDDVDDV